MGEQESVSEPTNQKSIFRFGLYELDGGTGELRKDGKLRPRVQGQPLDVLLHLLSRPGDVVTRDELRLLLWPVDTFVDYDHSLNTAVNKVRDALNDSADNPRFIQTIPAPRLPFHRLGGSRGGWRIAIPAEPKQAAQPRSRKLPRPSSLQRKTQFRAQRCARPSRRAARRRAIPFFAHSSDVSLLLRDLSGAGCTGWNRCFPRRLQHPKWLFALLLVTALVGIPIRLYLLSASIFGYRGLPVKFLRLFPFVIPLDELWALAPFLLVDQIGVGLALAATAALLYLPFSQRSLMLMGEINRQASRKYLSGF